MGERRQGGATEAGAFLPPLLGGQECPHPICIEHGEDATQFPVRSGNEE